MPGQRWEQRTKTAMGCAIWRSFKLRSRILCVPLMAATMFVAGRRSAAAQDAGQTTPTHAGHDMQHMPGMHMEAETPSWLPSLHAGAGTAWEPASGPAHMWMTRRGQWDLMAHGIVFLTYNQQGGPRGVGKAESVNWLMFMEQHRMGKGTVLFRQMFSAESLTAPHPGFPELFQTGETYHGQPLVDHQHPHNVFAELALCYTHPIGEKVTWLFYGGPSAEPALGPVAYLHRASAAELPLAPLSHHFQDSTHTSFGVVTTGFIIDRVSWRVPHSMAANRMKNDGAFSPELLTHGPGAPA